MKTSTGVLLTHCCSFTVPGQPSLNNLVSWGTFLNFWNKYYSNLIIRHQNADVCVDCYVSANIFKLRPKRKHSELSSDADDSSDDEDLEDPPEGLPELLPHGAKQFSIEAREAQILKAGEHVKLARTQRELFNFYIREARLYATGNVPHSVRTYMRIGDYSQKMEMPFFGAEQPSDSFFMSALNINCFGAVDPAGKVYLNVDTYLKEYKHLLHAYVYAEGTASCGGNAVASLLIKNLNDAGLLDPTKGPGGHFVAAFDNCPGQNKNNFVLKMLCGWLIERGFFKKVTVLFLVKGHTKNPCDHLFNTLKRCYRAQNIETFEDLLRILNQSDDVIVTEAVPGDFHNWKQFLQTFNSDFDRVLKYHLFVSEEGKDISLQIGDGHAKEWANLKHPKREKDEMRKERLSISRPEAEVPPGLKEIKMVELYTKFRPLLQQKNRNKTCPYPGDAVMKRVKDARKKKTATKKEKIAVVAEKLKE